MDNEKFESFGEWLEYELELRGWSQAILSRRTGLTSAAVSLLARDQTQPKAETCLAIAEALGIPPEVVMSHAGLLPPAKGDEDLATNEVLHIMRQLPPAEGREILEYARMRYRRWRITP